MVKPEYEQVVSKKKKYRAGKKTRVSRIVSHLRWIKRQSHVESIKGSSSTHATSTSILNPKIEADKESVDNPNIELSPELIAFKELYKSITYQKETIKKYNSLENLAKRFN